MAFEQRTSRTLSDEKWLPIPGFEGYYEASDQGRIRSLDRTVSRTSHSPMKLRGKVLSHQLRKNTGYYVVALSKDGKPRNWYVHRLVLMAFVGLPQDGQEACHENDIRTDNRLENLRWDSHSGNMLDAVRRGRHVNPNSGKTHCKRGHQLTYEPRQDRRVCYPCRRLNERRRYHEKKAA